MSKAKPSPDVEWIVTKQSVDYTEALEWMEARAAAVAAGTARECVWLLEHPPLYTAGTSANPADLIDPCFPVFTAGRGGQYTYHGPGQRVVYLILDLNQRGRDLRSFVRAVESWMIATLATLGVEGHRAKNRIGIWTNDPDQGEAKVGAIGIRVRRWVSFHGFSINLAPNLSHFDGIVPCGLAEYGVTSLSKLGISCSMEALDAALSTEFASFLRELSPA